ncbi:MAG: rhomboid family intramembrane serine protease [Myxococcota bacterium]|nr:rhomboid family intramembrane serine protease [Myxococcota bacterium]
MRERDWRERLRADARLLTGMILTLWSASAMSWVFNLSSWGILPRQSAGLAGIFFAPLLHTGPAHLLTNTVPLFVLSVGLLLHGRKVFFWVTLFGVFFCGGLTWLLARGQTLHIGASGLAFSYFGGILALGIFERSLKSILLSLGALFLYSGTLWGLLPNHRTNVSWEMHLFGFLSGGLAIWLRPRPRRIMVSDAIGGEL